MNRTYRGLLGVVAVCAGALALPGAALAEVRAGSAADPAGDFEIAQRDITATELTYDTQGSVSAKVTLAAPPDAASLGSGYGILLGSWDGSRCAVELHVHASTTGGSSAFMQFASGEKLAGIPTLSADAGTVTVSGSDPGIANKPYDCGGAETGDPANPDSGSDLQTVIQSLTPAAAQPPRKKASKLRTAIKRCKSRHKGSKSSAKRARKNCIRRARKKHG